MPSTWPVDAKADAVAEALMGVCVCEVRYGQWEAQTLLRFGRAKERLVVCPVGRVLDYLQILFSLPSPGLCWCGVVISTSLPRCLLWAIKVPN